MDFISTVLICIKCLVCSKRSHLSITTYVILQQNNNQSIPVMSFLLNYSFNDLLIQTHLTQVCVHRGKLVCVHLHLVYGLFKYTYPTQGLWRTRQLNTTLVIYRSQLQNDRKTCLFSFYKRICQLVAQTSNWKERENNNFKRGIQKKAQTKHLQRFRTRVCGVSDVLSVAGADEELDLGKQGLKIRDVWHGKLHKPARHSDCFRRPQNMNSQSDGTQRDLQNG